MIIHSDNTPLTIDDILDPDGMLYYTIYLKPPVWQASFEYIANDIISPSLPTGFYYSVKSSGISGAVEPVWSTVKNEETIDNTVLYKALDNVAYLNSTGNLTAATWSATNSVPIDNQSFTAAGLTTVQVGPVPSGVSTFTLTVSITVNSGHATSELDDRSIVINVEER